MRFDTEVENGWHPTEKEALTSSFSSSISDASVGGGGVLTHLWRAPILGRRPALPAKKLLCIGSSYRVR